MQDSTIVNNVPLLKIPKPSNWSFGGYDSRGADEKDEDYFPFYGFSIVGIQGRFFPTHR